MDKWIVIKIDPATGEREQVTVYDETFAIRMARAHQAAGFLGHIRPPIQDRKKRLWRP